MNDRPIRVLHTIHSLAGGGAERQLTMLSKLATGKSCEMGIFFVNDCGVDAAALGVQVYRSRTSNRFNVGVFHSLHRAIDQFRPDVIHTWLPASITIPSMVLASCHRIACLFSYRNAMSFQRGLQWPEFGLVWLSADRIVSNSPVDQSTGLYRRLFHRKDGIVIPNGVSVDRRFHKEPCKGRPTAQFEILFVGRITAQKNWGCLINALSLLPSDIPWHLTICGDGDQRNELDLMVASEGHAERVTMLGYQDNVYSIMQKADVLVSPSLYEGMSNVLLEGLAVGIPCVISNIPGHRFIVDGRNCVRMFHPTSPPQLADCLSDAFHRPDLSMPMVRNGMDVAESYSPAEMCQRYIALYRSMAL
jgi:glycosyltransferase involved in cell wall biosynthesis